MTEPRAPWILLIMPWGRVGSNLCLDVIAQSRRLRVFNEPLTAMRTHNPGLDEKDLWQLQRHWLDEHVAGRAPDGNVAVNLSAVSIADFDAFARFIHREPARIIVLDRKSVLRTILSAVRARAHATATAETGGKARWALQPGENSTVRPTVTRAMLRDGEQRIGQGRHRISQLAGHFPMKTYYYEDIETDLHGFLIDLLHETGVGWFDYTIRHAKFSPSDLSAAVANPAEARRWAAEMNIT